MDHWEPPSDEVTKLLHSPGVSGDARGGEGRVILTLARLRVLCETAGGTLVLLLETYEETEAFAYECEIIALYGPRVALERKPQ